MRALGVSAGLWQCLNFSLRNGEAKQTEQSAFRSKLNRRTTVWPVVHNILFQHWLHLKQTLSRHVHLSQRERGIWEKKSFDLNSINQSALSHRVLLCPIFFFSSQSAGHTQIFSLACHLCRSCALWGHARTESKVCERTELGGKRGWKAKDRLVIKEPSNQWLPFTANQFKWLSALPITTFFPLCLPQMPLLSSSFFICSTSWNLPFMSCNSTWPPCNPLHGCLSH